jgi:RNA polymerase sigma factor (sigma-70 family)
MNTTRSAAQTAFHPAVAANAVAWNEMVAHRSYLVRFAQRKLHDPMLAEDVVHDVFEAVISGRASFAGRAALRSWLTAILKNKIVDLVRSRAAYDSLDDERRRATRTACSRSSARMRSLTSSPSSASSSPRRWRASTRCRPGCAT